MKTVDYGIIKYPTGFEIDSIVDMAGIGIDHDFQNAIIIVWDGCEIFWSVPQ